MYVTSLIETNALPLRQITRSRLRTKVLRMETGSLATLQLADISNKYTI